MCHLSSLEQAPHPVIVYNLPFCGIFLWWTVPHTCFIGITNICSLYFYHLFFIGGRSLHFCNLNKENKIFTCQSNSTVKEIAKPLTPPNARSPTLFSSLFPKTSNFFLTGFWLWTDQQSWAVESAYSAWDPVFILQIVHCEIWNLELIGRPMPGRWLIILREV